MKKSLSSMLLVSCVIGSLTPITASAFSSAFDMPDGTVEFWANGNPIEDGCR